MMMKKIFGLFVFNIVILQGQCQENYWQQEVNYKIDVTLNDKNHSLNGNAIIEYINNSPDSLTFIWFHLWPNAYKNGGTDFRKQISKFYTPPFNRTVTKGYIDGLKFSVNGVAVKVEEHPDHNDVIKLILPTLLLPGGSVSIATPFYVKLPYYFSRLGYLHDSYFISQWYPKPAVYDHKGWHPMTYLDIGEFYSEFGNFDVSITLPSGYVVAATGILETETERAAYLSIGDSNHILNKINSTDYRVSYSFKTKDTKTLKWHAENVHDFAWFANENFILDHTTTTLPSGKVIDIFAYAQKNGSVNWQHAASYMEDVIKRYSNWISEYPYPVVSAVEAGLNEVGGGMEYPMVTLITTQFSEVSTDVLISHEIGHNWFYGALANNERDHAWMDEGINTYYEFRYQAEKYRINQELGNSAPIIMKPFNADTFLTGVYKELQLKDLPEPIEKPAQDFKTDWDYFATEYLKPAIWLHKLEQYIGKETFEKGMKAYFQKWKFNHPYPEDFQKVMEDVAGKKLDDIFMVLKQTGTFK